MKHATTTKTGKLVGNAAGFRLSYMAPLYVTIHHSVTVILFGCSTAMQGVLLTGLLRLVEQGHQKMR